MIEKYIRSSTRGCSPWLMFLALTGIGINVCAGSVDLVLDAGHPHGNGASNGIDDHFLIVRNAEYLDFYIDGKLSKQYPYDSIRTLTVEGSNDDDWLVVSFAHGNPIPPGGVFYNGNANAHVGDTLALEHGSFESVGHVYHNETDGIIHLDEDTLVYTGLEPVIDLVSAANLTINGTNSSNSITYTRGSSDSRGIVSVDNFETIEFENKTQITINGLNGSDDIVINNPSMPTSLTKIVVNAGEGDDNITLAVDSPIDVEINADNGDDIIRAKNSTANTINVDGGDHNIGDVLIAGAAENITGVKVNDTTISADGFQPVNFEKIENAIGLKKSTRNKLLKQRFPWEG